MKINCSIFAIIFLSSFVLFNPNWHTVKRDNQGLKASPPGSTVTLKAHRGTGRTDTNPPTPIVVKG